MNCKNANQELGFDKFSECDYNLHWSFSNFNRMLMVAGRIAQLPNQAKVLELGAGSSDLENLVKKNFKRDDIKFVKIDGDMQYELSETITVFDITSEECKAYVNAMGPFDSAVFMEVIEHIEEKDAGYVLQYIYESMKSNGLLLFTTPTPAYGKLFEERVWPDDHDYEFSYREIYQLINKYFKIEKEIGWSLEEREYTRLLEDEENLMRVYTKLRGAFPESYIKAIIACLSPANANRQILMICRKRRLPNGRFA